MVSPFLLQQVSCSSLLTEQPAKKRLLVEGQVVNVMCVEPEIQNNAKPADNSSDTEAEDLINEGVCVHLIDYLLQQVFHSPHTHPSYEHVLKFGSLPFLHHFLRFQTLWGKYSQ